MKNLSARSPTKGLYDDDNVDDNTDESGEIRIKETLEDEPQEKSQEEENEEIRNFITSMKNDDIEKLHQSLMGTLKEDELRKAMQEAKATIAQEASKKKQSNKKAKNDSDDEEIAEDIDENPVDDEVNTNKTSVRAESSYYGGRPISVRKPRPISATYNQVTQSRGIEPILASVPFQNKQFDSLKRIDSPKVESNTPQNIETSQHKNAVNPRLDMPLTPDVVYRKDVKKRESVQAVSVSNQDLKSAVKF